MTQGVPPDSGYYAVPHNPPPRPPGNGTGWPAWKLALAIIAGLVIPCGVVGIVMQNAPSATPADQKTTWTTTPPDADGLGTPAQPSPPPTSVEPVAGTIGEGTYEVGPEVAPGKYKSAGAKPSTFQLCVWTIKGSDGRVIDLGTANGETEQQLVTVKAGQVFESSGCHTWTKVG